MSQELLQTFRTVLVDTFDVPAEAVAPEVTFEALGLDSLDVVELTLVLEEELGVKLEDEELEDVRTVQDAIDQVDAKRRSAA